MTWKPMRLCNHPHCGNKSHHSYCDEHRKEAQQRQDRQYDKTKRDNKYTEFYKSGEWRLLRKRFIHKNPLCAKCLDNGESTPADVVDHIEEIKDNFERRLDESNLMSLCHACHNEKTAIVRASRQCEYKPMNKKVTIVTGSAGSGKSTYVKKNIQAGDLILDIDDIWMALTGLDMYEKPAHLVDIVVAVRNEICRVLERKLMSESVRAWIITTAKNVDELKRMFNADVVTMNVSKEECIERIMNDDRRTKRLDKHIKLVNDWYEKE